MEQLGDSNLGATIGDIRISALGFADDIVLVSDSLTISKRYSHLSQLEPQKQYDI